MAFVVTVSDNTDLAAYRLGTSVVDVTTSGAVPTANVLVICPVAEIVVNAALPGVPPPIAPGFANPPVPPVPPLAIGNAFV